MCPETAAPWLPRVWGEVRERAGATEPWAPPALAPAPLVRPRPPVRALEAPAPAPEPGEDPEAAYRRGLAEGRREAEAARAMEIETAVHGLLGAAQALGAARGRILHDLEANLGAVAVAAARKLVQREIEADPTLLRDLVARGLELARPDTPVRVHLHPADLETAATELERLAAGEDAEIRWTPDPELDRGGFRIEGPQRIVDGRLDEGLRALYERLAYE